MNINIDLDKKFELVEKYLRTFPAKISLRGKQKEAFEKDGISSIDFTNLKEKFISKRSVDKPSDPSTVPDQAVSIVMNLFFGAKEMDLERIKLEHQQSMIAENIVGGVLERYLAEELESEGWVWCSGDFVSAIDFIKQDAEGYWTELQVKNRNTTENSSSSKVRNGTTIMKWFRSFSKKPEYNWDEFPDNKAKSKLSEEGFRKYLKDYLKQVTD